MIAAAISQLLLVLASAQLPASLAPAPAPVPEKPPGAPRVVELNVTRAAPPVPALKYDFAPNVAALVPGNAAPIYLMAGELLPRDPKQREHVSNLLGLPMDQFPIEEARQALQPYHTCLAEVELAAAREDCRWDAPLRTEGVRTLLPYLNPCRELADALAVRARLEIAEKRFDDAARTIRTGFTMVNHLRSDGVIVQGLVAVAVGELFLDRVRELEQAPGAPNVYWALTALPHPLVDIRQSLRLERAVIGFEFTELRGRRPEELSPEELTALFPHMQRSMAAFSQSVPAYRQDGAAFDPEFLTAMISGYGAARHYLAAAGKSQQEIDAMPVQAALAIYLLESYGRWSDEIFKWSGLPYWQARAGYAGGQSELAQAERLEANPLLTVVPALDRAAFNFAKPDREIALAQCVEAVRAYAASHDGKLPSALADLTDTPAPIDPMTGKSLEYEVKGDTARIHAVPFPNAPANVTLDVTYVVKVR
ncbi:MAG: hypothetical protein JWP03_3841 [Phycisphaerales bacterium]|nr:hypothetical protein [Phycisphaerales bacterium]